MAAISGLLEVDPFEDEMERSLLLAKIECGIEQADARETLSSFSLTYSHISYF